ncbi:MAG: hypothetical protein H0U87_01015 [Acidobacteria bacterium]|jgi:hypothetical protein|nr:hypothetical protein [Acidobacteriota bacterium]
MKLTKLVEFATDKKNFTNVQNYIDFAENFLTFALKDFQAVIISQNETQYRFFQYKQDGYFNISRPVNANLFYGFDDAEKIINDFPQLLASVRHLSAEDLLSREILIKSIYTIQQCIGITLDALPSGASNQARKLNGDLFERFIQLLLKEVGVDCQTGTVKVPIYINGEKQFDMSYQHDLLLFKENELKVIGSVKTSSKDRIDKIFMDKFLYSKLTETEIPHIAIFLHDVQRKKTRIENSYGVNSTFLTGHFKAFTIKLNPLDGVYYCDVRPNMERDPLLKKHIKTIDHLFCSDVWQLTENEGIALTDVKIETES